MQAEITTDGQYVIAKIPWANGRGPDWARLVPGGRWHDGTKRWRYPLTMDTCRSFRRVYKGGLSVKKPLGSWARERVAAGERLEDYRSGVTVEFPKVTEEAPFLAAAMADRPYQPAGTAFMYTSRRCILGDDPGLGKTLQTLGTIILSDCKDILIGCPRTATRSVWERETERWAPTISTFVAQGTRAQRKKAMADFLQDKQDNPDERRILIINNEMVRARKRWRCKEPPEDYDGTVRYFRRKAIWDPPLPVWSEEPDSEFGCQGAHQHEKFVEYEWPFLFEQWWDAIVIDESHNLLAGTYNVMSKHITQGRLGAMLLRRRVKPGGLAIALSATPFRGKLTKAWGTLNWCDPKVFTSYWNFAGTHFGVVEGKFGRVIAEGDKVPKPKDKAAWDAMLRPYYLARDKKTAAPDLPDVQYTGTPHPDAPDRDNYVFLEMDPKQTRAYREMQKLAEARIRNGLLTANGTLAEVTRLRQFAVSYGRMRGEDFIPDLPSNKWDWILNFLEEHGHLDGKYLVASTFTKVINLLHKKLQQKKISSITLTGATSDRGRSEMIRRFSDLDDPVKVGLINTKAGGTSVTLDAACDDIILLDPPWLADDEEQVIGRIHRVSRIHQVFVHRLISEGTAEEWMALNGQEQRSVISSNKPKARREAALEVITWPS